MDVGGGGGGVRCEGGEGCQETVSQNSKQGERAHVAHRQGYSLSQKLEGWAGAQGVFLLQ